IKRYNELKEKLFNEDFKAESLEQNEEIKEFLRTLIKYNTERLTIEDIFYLEDNFLEYIFNSSYVNDIDFFIFLYNTLKDKLDMSIVNPTTIRDCKFVDSILHLKLKEINLTNEQKENFKNILLDLIDKNN
ncbi:MAG: hypothetical protein N2485_08505, partial [bacterium]|nr:hypothetical protein [bacterium]